VLTLDEAVAKFEESLYMTETDWDMNEEPYQIPDRDAIRAAVRNVALASAREARDTGLPHTEAEILRLLGPEKAGA